MPERQRPPRQGPAPTAARRPPPTTVAPPAVAGRDLDPASALHLQRLAGNRAVQRALGARAGARGTAATSGGQPVVQRNGGPLPSIAHLSPMLQTLLTGALAKSTVDEAVRQIYDNMFTLTGWTYTASNLNTNGRSYCEAGATVGMCESYREAFRYALGQYDALRPSHPDAAISGGALAIVPNQTLVGARFVTNTGLTLMGGLRGNVYLQVDGHGNQTATGLGTINKFVFRHHWTLDVNGVNYDPIFYSIGHNNVATIFDANYFDGNEVFLADQTKPIPTGEFGATFVHLTDFAAFHNLLHAMDVLYAADAGRFDGLVQEGKTKKFARGLFRRQAPEVAAARNLVAQIGDRATFAELVRIAYALGRISMAERTAFNRVTVLADTY